MQTIYRADLKAHVSVDGAELVRHPGSDEYWASEHTSPLATAGAYLDAMADTLRIDKAELAASTSACRTSTPSTRHRVPAERGEATLRVDADRLRPNASERARAAARLTVRVKLNPTRVVGMTNNSEGELRAKLPPAQTIERYRAIFRNARPQGGGRGRARRGRSGRCRRGGSSSAQRSRSTRLVPRPDGLGPRRPASTPPQRHVRRLPLGREQAIRRRALADDRPDGRGDSEGAHDTPYPRCPPSRPPSRTGKRISQPS